MSDQEPKVLHSDKNENGIPSNNINYINPQFDQLVKFAKLYGGIVLLAISIVASVIMYFTFSSINDMKEEVAGVAIKIVTESKEMKKELQQSLIYSQQQMEIFLNYSKEGIDRVNDFSERNIRYITEEAVYQAEKSAQKEVEEFFENDAVIGAMINTTAKEVLSEFKKEVNEYTRLLPDIFIAVERIGRSDRAGLNAIISLTKNSENIIVVETATKIFEEKKADYTKAYDPKTNPFWGDDLISFFRYIEDEAIKGEPKPRNLAYISFWDYDDDASYLREIARKESWINPDKTQLVKELIYSIGEDGNLDAVALAHFLVLEMTDIECELFDFEGFKVASESYEIKPEYLE